MASEESDPLDFHSTLHKLEGLQKDLETWKNESKDILKGIENKKNKKNIFNFFFWKMCLILVNMSGIVIENSNK